MAAPRTVTPASCFRWVAAATMAAVSAHFVAAGREHTEPTLPQGTIGDGRRTGIRTGQRPVLPPLRHRMGQASEQHPWRPGSRFRTGIGCCAYVQLSEDAAHNLLEPVDRQQIRLSLGELAQGVDMLRHGGEPPLHS